MVSDSFELDVEIKKNWKLVLDWGRIQKDWKIFKICLELVKISSDGH